MTTTRQSNATTWAIHILERLAFPLLLLVLLSRSAVHATKLTEWEGTHWCKCICFANYTILPLLDPESPSKPCLSCTKQWCLDQQLPICDGAVLGDPDPDTATGKEGDVEARCFQRDSPRDQLVVTMFLIIVFGLLVGAAIKGRMNKAGIQANWNLGTRRWWESMLPSTQNQPVFGMNSRTNGERRTRRDGYQDLDTEEDVLPTRQ